MEGTQRQGLISLERGTTVRIVMVLLLAVSLTGCAASLERDTSLNSVGQKASNGTNYRIGPLDVLDLSVFQAPDLSKTVAVAEDGTIDVPLLGATPAAGKTAYELQRDLSAKLGAKYLQNPQI